MSGETDRDDRTKRVLAAFGRRIVQLRDARSWTSAELAERCGLSADMLEQIESGTTSATFEDMRRLAGALGVSLSELVDYVDK
jgi:transcriptional regulator with XRE-family HTH domain